MSSIDGTEGINQESISAAEYWDLAHKPEDPEKLTYGFTADGASANNYTDIKARRDKDPLFTEEQKLGKDDFLLLLTTQLKYQDPLEPMKNDDFIAQMAQFTSLESMNSMEEALLGMDDSYHKSLALQQESADALSGATQSIADSLATSNLNDIAMNNALTAGLIGKDVRVQADQIMMARQNGVMEPRFLNFHTDVPANEVKIRIYDKDDNLVRTLNAESASERYQCEPYGDHWVLFDGLDSEGNVVKDGTYRLEIEAKNGGQQVNAYLFEQGTVGGIDFRSTGTMLQVKSRDYTWEKEHPDEGVRYYVSTLPIGSIIAVREHIEVAESGESTEEL